MKPILILQRKCLYYLVEPSVSFPSINELLTYYIDNQVSISKHEQFFLKQPIYKEIKFKESEQISVDHNDILFDDAPVHTERLSHIYFATLKHFKQRVTVKKCVSGQFSEKQQFLQEANMLKKLEHSNVIKLLSICNKDEAICTVLEVMSGNFLQILQESGNGLTTYQLTSFMLDAAMGMEYLSSQNYIHMNLCAMSCMVRFNDHDKVLKICDFSMCRKVKNGYHAMEGDAKDYMSIRWTAFEVCVNIN